MIQSTRRVRQTLVLTEADDHRLLFQFQGKTWALTTGAMSIWLLSAGGFLWWQRGFTPYLGLFGLFAVVLAGAAVASATTVRGLEIDRHRGSVRYGENSMARKEVWEKPFSEFASISIHYPSTNQGGRPNRRHPAVEIVSRDGAYFRIGTRPAGGTPEATLRKLAERVGDMMGLPVVASIGKN
jgi:hypothetical protein